MAIVAKHNKSAIVAWRIVYVFEVDQQVVCYNFSLLLEEVSNVLLQRLFFISCLLVPKSTIFFAQQATNNMNPQPSSGTLDVTEAIRSYAQKIVSGVGTVKALLLDDHTVCAKKNIFIFY